MRYTNFLQELCDSQVRFVLVGGMAVQLHGYARSTLDMDIVLAMDDANLTKFIDMAKKFGLVPIIPVPIDSLKNAQQIEQWYQEKGMLAFSLREPQNGGRSIDVLVRPEVPFDDMLAQSVCVNLFARQVRIASIDHLLTMKRKANRSRDRIDIEALEKIKRGEDPND